MIASQQTSRSRGVGITSGHTFSALAPPPVFPLGVRTLFHTQSTKPQVRSLSPLIKARFTNCCRRLLQKEGDPVDPVRGWWTDNRLLRRSSVQFILAKNLGKPT